VSGMKFSPGSVVATPGALEAFRASGESPLTFLERHLAGDWGDLDEHDRCENELSQFFRSVLQFVSKQT